MAGVPLERHPLRRRWPTSPGLWSACPKRRSLSHRFLQPNRCTTLLEESPGRMVVGERQCEVSFGDFCSFWGGKLFPMWNIVCCAEVEAVPKREKMREKWREREREVIERKRALEIDRGNKGKIAERESGVCSGSGRIFSPAFPMSDAGGSIQLRSARPDGEDILPCDLVRLQNDADRNVRTGKPSNF